MQTHAGCPEERAAFIPPGSQAPGGPPPSLTASTVRSPTCRHHPGLRGATRLCVTAPLVLVTLSLLPHPLLLARAPAHGSHLSRHHTRASCPLHGQCWPVLSPDGNQRAAAPVPKALGQKGLHWWLTQPPPSAHGRVPGWDAVGAGDTGRIQPTAILSPFSCPCSRRELREKGPEGVAQWGLPESPPPDPSLSSPGCRG